MALGRGDKAVSEYEKLKKLAADARLPFDKDFLLNIAFFLGEQYSVWNPDDASVKEAKRSDGLENAPRPVVNKITHFVMKQRASALEAKPAIDVMPATDDPEDASIASVGLSYLKWLGEPHVADLDGELAEAVLWSQAGGEGYLKWTWNVAENRPDIMACAGTEVFIDPYARKFRTARYIIHEQYMDIHQVKHIYGKDVHPTSRSKTDMMKSALLRDMGVAPIQDGVVVNELWLKPKCDPRWPEGKMVVWAGCDVLYESDKYPYEHGHLPFAQIGSIPRPGSAHYTCSVKNLRAPQMELNKFHAQLITVREMFANPKWWIPNELELEAAPDDSANQILRGNSGGGQYMPSIIQPANMLDSDGGEWIVDEMNDAAGQHETSRGQVPGRVEAARAIEMLKQADESALAELNRTIGTAIAHGGYMSLMLLKQFGDEEQMVHTYSREGLPEIKKFKKALLKDGMSVRILQGTGLATTRAARQDQVMLYWQNGILTDPEVVAELMELPVGRTSPQKAYDIRLARNENLIIAEDDEEVIKQHLGKSELAEAEKNGVAMVPHSWDDHDIHIREHDTFRKSGEFDTLTNEAQVKFEFHVQTHKDLRLAKLKEQLEEQTLGQQAGGVPSGQSPPAAAPIEDASAPAEDEAAAPTPM